MDRLEFSKSLDVDPVIQVKNYFNEIMGAYNLFGKYEGLTVKGLVDNQSISFALSFETEKEAEDMHNVINGSTMYIYDDIYIISSIIYSNNLTVRLLLY